jgi:hypothetical protein
LFAFDAPSFHPIYATTFLLNFFQHIIIEGRAFESSAGQLLNTSSLARHTGIVRFWTRGSMVMDCTLRWSHSHARPWGKSVPFQCPYCYCIQAWDQSGRGASSELGRDITTVCVVYTKESKDNVSNVSPSSSHHNQSSLSSCQRGFGWPLASENPIFCSLLSYTRCHLCRRVTTILLLILLALLLALDSVSTHRNCYLVNYISHPATITSVLTVLGN